MTSNAKVLLSRTISKVRFRHIQLVVLAADLGSTHKVAEAAAISQPSVVKFIVDLEELLEATLFERHSRGLRPTPTCRSLLPFFRSMLRLAQRNAQSLADLMTGTTGIIHVGALPAACHGAIMSAIAGFIDAHPDVHLHLHEGILAELDNGLTSGTMDVLLTRQSAQSSRAYGFYPLMEEWPVVLARAGHPLTALRSVDSASLARERWILFPQHSVSKAVYDSWFDDVENRPVELNFTTFSLAATIELIASSDLLTVIPNSLAQQALATGRVRSLSIRRRDAMPPLGLVWRDDTIQPVARLFVEWMKTSMESETTAVAKSTDAAAPQFAQADPD